MTEIQVFRKIDYKVGLISSDEVLISTVESAVELIGNYYHEGFEKIVLHEHNLTPLFFDLKTGLAGEILQKFTNYRLALTVIGDFDKYNSKSLNDFIRETNRQGLIHFVETKEEALLGFI